MTIQKLADRLRHVLAERPRLQTFKLTRGEAEAVAAAAPLETFSIDTREATDEAMRRVIARHLGRQDELDEAIAETLAGRWFGQELRRYVEYVDRELADIEAMAGRARRELREGALPLQLVTGSGWDQTVRGLRERTLLAEGLIQGARGYAYATTPKKEDTTDA